MGRQHWTWNKLYNPNSITDPAARAAWQAFIDDYVVQQTAGFTSALGLTPFNLQRTIQYLSTHSTPYYDDFPKLTPDEGGGQLRIDLITNVGQEDPDVATAYDDAGPNINTVPQKYVIEYGSIKLLDEVTYDAIIRQKGLLPLLYEISATQMQLVSRNSQSKKLLYGSKIALPAAYNTAVPTLSATGGTVTNTSGGDLTFKFYISMATGDGYWFGYSNLRRNATTAGLRCNVPVLQTLTVVVPNGTTTGLITLALPFMAPASRYDIWCDNGTNSTTTTFYSGSTTGATYIYAANAAATAGLNTCAQQIAAGDQSANVNSYNGLVTIATNALDPSGNLVVLGAGGSSPTGSTIVDMLGNTPTGRDGTIGELDDPIADVQSLLAAPISKITAGLKTMQSITNLMRRTMNAQTIVVSDGQHADKVEIVTYQNKSMQEAVAIELCSDRQMIEGDIMADYHKWDKPGLDTPPQYMSTPEPWDSYHQDGQLDNTTSGKGRRQIVQVEASEAPVNAIPAGTIVLRRSAIAA